MGTFIDITGKRFGILTVLYREDNDFRGRAVWRCKCDCGNEASVLGQRLRSGHTKSCGCLNRATPHNFNDLTGKRYGRLTVLRRVGTGNGGKALWECVCDCGNAITTISHSLTSGSTRSCGCLKEEMLVDRSTKHGMRHTRLYNIWAKIKSRTMCESDSVYKWYGARGISMCNEWKDSFESFHEWSLSNGYDDGLTIDRIDNNSGYSPDNCRWVDMLAQANNKSNNRRITIDGETHTLAEWGRISGIRYGTLRQRIKAGWDDEDLIMPTARTNHKTRKQNEPQSSFLLGEY